MRTSQEVSDAFFSASTGNVESLNNMLGTSYTTFDEAMAGIEKNQGGLVDGMSQTLGGLVSTIQGKLANTAKNIVKPFTDALTNGMSNMINIIDTVGPKIEGFFGDLAKGDGSNFPVITNLINSFNILKGAVMPVFEILKEQFSKIHQSVSEKFGGSGSIIEGVSKVIAEVIKGLTPVLELLSPIFEAIMVTVETVWPIIQNLITNASKIIADSMNFIIPVVNSIIEVMKVLSPTVATVWNKVQSIIMTVWGNLKPVLDLFATLVEKVANLFTTLWPGISTVVKGVWDVVGGIFDKISEALGWIAEKAEKVVGWFGKWGSAAKDASDKTSVANSSANSVQRASDGSSNFAYGLRRVPYDGYKTTLHSDERVLTASEARQLDNNTLSSGINISISGMTIREEADIEKVASALARKISEQKIIYGGGVA